MRSIFYIAQEHAFKVIQADLKLPSRKRKANAEPEDAKPNAGDADNKEPAEPAAKPKAKAKAKGGAKAKTKAKDRNN